MPQIPEGYYLVEDDSYLIQKENRYYFTGWGNNPYETIHTYFRASIGLTIRKAQEISGAKNSRISIITKYPPKPKFPTDKPYPFGY